MSDFLLGVPGKLKTISDYLATNLATGRAALIDRLDATISSRASAAAVAAVAAALDATISSRAAASTALSSATWPQGLATKLNDSPLLSPPIAALVDTSGYSTSTSFATVHTYTGKGVLTYASVVGGYTSVGTAEVWIDGVLYVTGGALLVSKRLVGTATSFEAVPFNASLEVKIKIANGGSLVTAYWRYRKTA